MNSTCRLCHCEGELRGSHIIPKLFYNNIKANSPIKNTRIRSVFEPNRPVQDGLKLPFLCADCEEKFSKYETFFSNRYMHKSCFDTETSLDTDNNELRYFVLSMAWRVIQYDKENGIRKSIHGGITEKEITKSEKITEIWRNLLLDENHIGIRNIQMHLIPLAIIDIYCDDGSHYPTNGVTFVWRCYGEKDSFNYACVFIKTPKYFFFVTIWGNTSDMNSLAIGQTVKVIDYQLPQFVLELLSEQQGDFVDSRDKISENQQAAIIERATTAMKDNFN